MKKAGMNIYYTGLYGDIYFNLSMSEISGSGNKHVVELNKKMPNSLPAWSHHFYSLATTTRAFIASHTLQCLVFSGSLPSQWTEGGISLLL